MSMHWKQMDTSTRIERIQSIWRPGMSASQIAAVFEGATRNGIAGFYHRHRSKLSGCPLRVRVETSAKVKRKRDAQPKPKKAASMKVHPIPETVAAPVSRFLPLHALGHGECKYPTNNAASGEDHLFCGAEAEGSYCAFHTRLAYRPARSRAA